jgi:hypothetical protein
MGLQIQKQGYMKVRLLDENSHVEAGSNTSTVALRVVGGDEKGIQCLGVKLGHPVSGRYKYGDLVLQVGGSLEYKRVKYGHESCGTRT